MRKRSLLTTQFLCLLFLLSLTGCARNLIILKSSNEEFIIPKGTSFTAIWDGKVQTIKADDDVAVVYKGYLLKLKQDAIACVVNK